MTIAESSLRRDSRLTRDIPVCLRHFSYGVRANTTCGVIGLVSHSTPLP
jgi:hypothetical protein